MYKLFFAFFLAISTMAFAESPTETLPSPKEETYTYQPSTDYRAMDKERIMVLPKDSQSANGVGLWCNTLRGTGSVVLAIGDVVIFLALNCEGNPKTDI